MTKGKVKVIAKSAKKSRKRFGPALDRCSHINTLIDFKKEGISRIDEANFIEGHFKIKSDISRLAPASYISELTDVFTPDGYHNENVFHLLTDFLCCIEEGLMESETLMRFFEIRLLDYLGYMPHFESCVVCKKENVLSKEKNHYSSCGGGLVCKGCKNGHGDFRHGEFIEMSNGTAMFMLKATELTMDKLTRLSPSKGFLEEAERFLKASIDYHVGRDLKSRLFMDKMKLSSFITA